MLKHLIVLLVLWPIAVYGDDGVVGQLIEFGGKPPSGWVEADGRCLEDSQYPELAAALHVGNNWPYGRCDETHFRIPDLTDKDKRARYILNVK